MTDVNIVYWVLYSCSRNVQFEVVNLEFVFLVTPSVVENDERGVTQEKLEFQSDPGQNASSALGEFSHLRK